MREIVFSLCLLFLCLRHLQRLSLHHAPLPVWSSVVWTIAFSLTLRFSLADPLQLRALVCFSLGALIWIQDAYDGWFSWRWLAAAALWLLSAWPASLALADRLAGCLWMLPALFFARRGWMGWADPWAVGAAGLALGGQRMIVAMLAACLYGLASGLLRRRRRLPFLCYLSTGALLGLLRGWSLWSFPGRIV